MTVKKQLFIFLCFGFCSLLAQEQPSAPLAATGYAPLSSGNDIQEQSAVIPKLSIPLVIVGDPDNEPDIWTKHGHVENTFSIGLHDVTAEEYCAFLNAVASFGDPIDPHFLYDPMMGLDEAVKCIACSEADGVRTYSIIKEPTDKPGLDRGKFPITYVDINSAARFCNWLQNGQPTGFEESGKTETGSYEIAEGSLSPSANATWFLPTEDQIYKCTYHKKGCLDAEYYEYPNKSSSVPGNHLTSQTDNEANYYYTWLWDDYSSGNGYATGGAPYLTPFDCFSKSFSPYGALDTDGNVAQWTSTVEGQINGNKTYVVRGGSWMSFSDQLTKEASRDVVDGSTRSNTIGFRVATYSYNDIQPPAAPVQPADSRSSTLERIGEGIVAVGGIVAVVGAGEKGMMEHRGEDREQIIERQRGINEHDRDATDPQNQGNQEEGSGVARGTLGFGQGPSEEQNSNGGLPENNGSSRMTPQQMDAIGNAGKQRQNPPRVQREPSKGELRRDPSQQNAVPQHQDDLIDPSAPQQGFARLDTERVATPDPLTSRDLDSTHVDPPRVTSRQVDAIEIHVASEQQTPGTPGVQLSAASSPTSLTPQQASEIGKPVSTPDVVTKDICSSLHRSIDVSNPAGKTFPTLSSPDSENSSFDPENSQTVLRKKPSETDPLVDPEQQQVTPISPPSFFYENQEKEALSKPRNKPSAPHAVTETIDANQAGVTIPASPGLGNLPDIYPPENNSPAGTPHIKTPAEHSALVASAAKSGGQRLALNDSPISSSGSPGDLSFGTVYEDGHPIDAGNPFQTPANGKRERRVTFPASENDAHHWYQKRYGNDTIPGSARPVDLSGYSGAGSANEESIDELGRNPMIQGQQRYVPIGSKAVVLKRVPSAEAIGYNASNATPVREMLQGRKGCVIDVASRFAELYNQHNLRQANDVVPPQSKAAQAKTVKEDDYSLRPPQTPAQIKRSGSFDSYFHHEGNEEINTPVRKTPPPAPDNISVDGTPTADVSADLSAQDFPISCKLTELSNNFPIISDAPQHVASDFYKAPFSSDVKTPTSLDKKILGEMISGAGVQTPVAGTPRAENKTGNAVNPRVGFVATKIENQQSQKTPQAPSAPIDNAAVVGAVDKSLVGAFQPNENQTVMSTPVAPTHVESPVAAVKELVDENQSATALARTAEGETINGVGFQTPVAAARATTAPVVNHLAGENQSATAVAKTISGEVINMPGFQTPVAAARATTAPVVNHLAGESQEAASVIPDPVVSPSDCVPPPSNVVLQPKRPRYRAPGIHNGVNTPSMLSIRPGQVNEQRNRIEPLSSSESTPPSTPSNDGTSSAKTPVSTGARKRMNLQGDRVINHWHLTSGEFKGLCATPSNLFNEFVVTSPASEDEIPPGVSPVVATAIKSRQRAGAFDETPELAEGGLNFNQQDFSATKTVPTTDKKVHFKDDLISETVKPHTIFNDPDSSDKWSLTPRRSSNDDLSFENRANRSVYSSTPASSAASSSLGGSAYSSSDFSNSSQESLHSLNSYLTPQSIHSVSDLNSLAAYYDSAEKSLNMNPIAPGEKERLIGDKDLTGSIHTFNSADFLNSDYPSRKRRFENISPVSYGGPKSPNFTFFQDLSPNNSPVFSIGSNSRKSNKGELRKQPPQMKATSTLSLGKPQTQAKGASTRTVAEESPEYRNNSLFGCPTWVFQRGAN